MQTYQATSEGKSGEITITYDSEFSLDEQPKDMRQRANFQRVLDFITKIVKKSLYDMDYKQIGRLPKFFNT